MENNKNTVLLTVIAIATLLVAVIGATFAYFTAQGGAPAGTDVTVRTQTADSTMFTVDGGIEIIADQNNFAQGMPNIERTSTDVAMFEASTAAAASKCYTLALNVTKNEFVYSVDHSTEDPTPETAELKLTVTKASVASASRTTKSNPSYGAATTLINELDITPTTVSTYYIPNVVTSSLTDMLVTPTSTCSQDETSATLTNIHRLTATAGTFSADKFQVKVTLVNKDYDQIDITEKEFAARLVFTALDSCIGVNQVTPCA